jgi:hypothetical protein
MVMLRTLEENVLGPNVVCWNLGFGTSGEVVAEVSVVVWCAMCAIARSFSLCFFVCLPGSTVL